MSVSLGVVSEGTLATRDLLSAFAYEMRGENRAAFELAESIIEALDIDESDESPLLESFLDDAFAMLESIAPPYTYFGSADGDGACFGFWPDMASIDELPTVDDSDGARAMGEDCRAVSDHGNITVYSASGAIIWDCV